MFNSLPHILENAVQRYPQQEAVRCDAKYLTYATLSDQANRLACLLQKLGVKRGDRVGVYMIKDVEAVIAIYGIMQAGAAYVPLDPYAPVSRIKDLVADCTIRIIITQDNMERPVRQLLSITGLDCVIGLSPQTDFPVKCFSWGEILSSPIGTGKQSNTGIIQQDLAYILYTSGSTGTPKGIMHTHGSALSFAEWAVDTYGLQFEDRVSNHAPFHFDLSIFDLFSTAIAGATLIIIPDPITKFPASLSQLIQDERISIWYSVPFALIQLLERGALSNRDLGSLRWVLFAGEPFPTKHLREIMRFLPQARFSNLYGPTETNVCTYYHVDALPEGLDTPIPIGQVCANSQALVVDEADEPVAIGEIGELLIRGGTVMQGYWNRPELNMQSFYRQAIFDSYENYFYRTGDLVQERSDGNYIYHGRKDRQVKTRGYRIELDEIEAALLSHEEVLEAAVYVIPDGQGSNLIEATVVPINGTTLTQGVLIKHMAGKLPFYALPVHIFISDQFPRTSTGKIDRRALQAEAQARKQ